MLVGLGLGIFSVMSGCARGVDTVEGTDAEGDEAGTAGTTSAGTSSGGSGSGSSSGGSAETSGSSNAGSGGKISNAFGGTSTTGGMSSTAGSSGKGGSGGAAGSAGKGGASGSAGSGGKASGGSTSTAGAAGSAGAAGTAGSGGGSGTPLACLQTWKGDKCDTCSTQTQSDKLGCVDILNCYETNACGPGTCDGNSQKCGANVIAKGTAGYPIAADVYNCLCK